MSGLALGIYLFGIALLVPILMDEHPRRVLGKALSAAVFWPGYALVALVTLLASLLGLGIVLGVWIGRRVASLCRGKTF